MLIWTFLSCKFHVIVIFFILSWKRVSFNLFKRPKTILITSKNVKLNKGNFFLWFFNGYCLIYDHIDGMRDPLKQDLLLGYYKNQNKVISILTETHINHSQIHQIRNNCFLSNFFSLGDSHTKEYLSCFIWDWKVDTDPKGRFVSFKFTPSNNRVLCVYAPSWYSTISVDTKTSLQRCWYVAIQRCSNVAIELRWKRRTTLQKRRRCNIL